MRGIEHLHPEAQEKAKQLQALCDSKGLKLLITETLRTASEQDALYAQGRTIPGKIVTNCKGSSYQSPHQWGVAFDFCKNIKGQEYSDTAFFNYVGSLAKSIGLFWGGDFKSFIDTPHLELPVYLPNNSTITLKTKYGTPEKFKATWDKNIGDGSAVPQNNGRADPALTIANYPTIKKGSKGEYVVILQKKLGGLTADGVFGNKTEAAVKTFQRFNDLAADGIVGPKTWAAIL